MDDKKLIAKSAEQVEQPHSTMTHSIYPETTHQMHGDNVAPRPPLTIEDITENKLIRQRISSLPWLAIPMLIFGLLVLLVLLLNPSEFENYQYPHSYQLICYATAIISVTGAIILLISKSIALVKALAIALFISFGIGALETAYILLSHFTISLFSGAGVAIAITAYFLASLYFTFCMWTFISEIKSIS